MLLQKFVLLTLQIHHLLEDVILELLRPFQFIHGGHFLGIPRLVGRVQYIPQMLTSVM